MPGNRTRAKDRGEATGRDISLTLAEMLQGVGLGDS